MTWTCDKHGRGYSLICAACARENRAEAIAAVSRARDAAWRSAVEAVRNGTQNVSAYEVGYHAALDAVLARMDGAK